MRMRTLVLLLVLIVLSAFAYANHQRRATTGTSFIGLLYKTAAVTADDKGRTVFKQGNMTITVLEPVVASALSNGSQIRMATTLTTYDPFLALSDGTQVKTKVTQAIYNCDELEMYIKAIVALDKDDAAVVKNFEVNAVVPMAKGSTLDDIRKHVCKTVPNKAVSNKNYI